MRDHTSRFEVADQWVIQPQNPGHTALKAQPTNRDMLEDLHIFCLVQLTKFCYILIIDYAYSKHCISIL